MLLCMYVSDATHCVDAVFVNACKRLRKVKRLSYVCLMSVLCLSYVCLMSVLCLSYVCLISVLCLSCICLMFKSPVSNLVWFIYMWIFMCETWVCICLRHPCLACFVPWYMCKCAAFTVMMIWHPRWSKEYEVHMRVLKRFYVFVLALHIHANEGLCPLSHESRSSIHVSKCACDAMYV